MPKSMPAETVADKPVEQTVPFNLSPAVAALAKVGAEMDHAPDVEAWISRAIAFSVAMSCRTIEEDAIEEMNDGGWSSNALPDPTCFS